MIINDKEFIWVEKYRPQCVNDLILPNNIKQKLKSFVKEPCNILLASTTPGTGKTSVANAIIKESKCEALFLNASLERGIDTLRGKIYQFASTQSYDGSTKIVVLDEADNFSIDSSQPALRGFIEEFSANCRFILTCNYASKIIEPILNRFEVYDFDAAFSNPNELIPQIYERLEYILNLESIKFEKSDLIKVIKNQYPSIRGMIMTLQKCSYDNKLNVDSVSNDSDFSKLFDFIKKKDFEGIIKFIYGLNNASSFYSFAFKHILDSVYSKKSQIIMILAKYQDLDIRVRDKNLNLAACIMELAPLIS